MQMNRRRKPLQIIEEIFGFLVVGATLYGMGYIIFGLLG